MKGGVLKYAALAAGAYLLWRSGALERFGLVPAVAAPAPVPTGGGAATAVPAPSTMTTTPTVTGGGAPTATAPAPSVAYTGAQIDAMTKAAAGGDMAAAAILTGLGVRYNGHQWNWFREQAGNAPAPATEGLDNVMSATDYLAYRLRLGLGRVSLGGLVLGGDR